MANQVSIADLQAQIEALKAQLASKANNTLSYKVSEKGAVSIIGLQRFPVTLYVSQFERLIADIDKLKAFMTANKDKLKQGKNVD